MYVLGVAIVATYGVTAVFAKRAGKDFAAYAVCSLLLEFAHISVEALVELRIWSVSGA